ncbi:ATP/GTP-binding protein [Schlesneria sp. T3-172]|uniref:AAA family ATPase n=1 Tax=Schlesneria sphaerica TaxID=3373610 RepID=UPI0037CB147C
MLIEFRVENHRSLRDEQALSMEAARIGDETDSRPREVPNQSMKLLPVVAIYGANGSGKSNVLAALTYMKEAVNLSHRLWGPDEGVPREPFAWGQKREELSLFEVQMIIEGIRYQYGFLCNDVAFVEEWIYAWPNGKKQIWLEREGDQFKFGENLKGENKVIEGVTRPNALFLSAAAQLRHSQLWPLFSWFGSIHSLNLTGGPAAPRRVLSTQYRDERELVEMLDESSEGRQRTLFDEDPPESVLNQFKAMLQAADIGIVDVRLNRDELTGAGRPLRGSRFQLKHQSESDDAWLPLEQESGGTRTLFRLAFPILRSLRTGSTLLVDELESSMHPMLADLIVRQFNDPEINKRNAQLIFSTHDTNLLGTLVGEPALRRDQVWLTEKDARGATVLYPLTDFKPRKDENIERGYIQGRYGAIPFLGDFRFPAGDVE